MRSNNQSWKLETFIDTLTVELDKVRETLAVKALNKPLTYSVKDVELELQIFPEFDGDDIRFLTAKPGQQGASKVSLQLGSITDRQVRETSKAPSANDISIEEVEDIDQETKKELRKIGITSVGDLKKTEPILKKTGKPINYNKLANLINRSRRDQHAPRIQKVSLSQANNNRLLDIRGEYLALSSDFTPVVKINNKEAQVLEASEELVRVIIPQDQTLSQANEVIIAFDPYALYTLNLKN
ncbi:hypothetical protein [Roseivirga thermotolerans]|uniref:hypothetical protein n=1 Tax=Roseivirga thermotolerans TaxID=1758176 RepID=UPI00273F15F4|nr:hypothetical protein [Roseivirga thermotolerans]